MSLSAQDWTALPVYRAYRAYLAALVKGCVLTKVSLKLDPDIEREKLSAALDALSAYFHPVNWVDGGVVELLPPEIAQTIEAVMRRLLAGDRVPSFEAARQSPGRRSLDAKQALSSLVLYVRAARGRKGAAKNSIAHLLKEALADRDPVETVRVAFGMNSRQHVYEILKDADFSDIDAAIAFLDWPDIASRATMIRQGMEQDGKRWSVIKSAKAYARHIKLRQGLL